MTSIQSLSQGLVRYLSELNWTIQYWQQWLEELEGATTNATQQPTDSTVSSEILFQSLNDLLHSRKDLLTEAQQLGTPANSLHSLAQSLPVWTDQRFRNSFEAARNRLAQLRRSHVAAWVLLRESTDFCQDALMLMMSGKTHRDFTIDQSPPEAGGHLLDASL